MIGRETTNVLSWKIIEILDYNDVQSVNDCQMSNI